MEIAVTVTIPVELLGEALPLLAQSRGIDLEGKNLQEQRNAVAQAIADEQVESIKHLVKAKRMREATDLVEAEFET